MGLADPELSVVLCDNDTIHAINKEWRGEDKPTDVLSFPLHEFEEPGVFDPMLTAFDGEDGPGLSLGDIIISLEYAEGLLETREHHRRVAQELGVAPESLAWSFDDEVHFLLIHGILHLVGHDHMEVDEEEAMKAEERRLWEHAAAETQGDN
ncbi:putative rRNA maturation factor [Bradymonas sediminis]|nr:putative rRNA maturation factor [Bradymonas sediminis]